jgi:hypothetical protein
MSPNEFQLRAALRDGEGDHIDPDTVIARARAVTQARHDRRVRYGSVAAIVAVVGGIGVVAGVALHGGGTNNNATSSADSQKATGSSAAAAGADAKGGGAANAPIAPGPMADAAAVTCPTTAPSLKLPGGGGANNQFGAGGSLFGGKVEAIKVCAYQQNRAEAVPGPNGQPLNTVLVGEQATELAASLDAAPKERPRTPCPLYRTGNGKTIVIIGISTSGAAMRPITATVQQNPCNLPVTNGTAVRYNWTPPGSLMRFIAKLQPIIGGPIKVPPSGGISVAPSGKVTASPIRS